MLDFIYILALSDKDLFVFYLLYKILNLIIRLPIYSIVKYFIIILYILEIFKTT